MINVGLVGFGLSGRHLQAPFFLSHPAFSLRTVVTSQDLPFSEVKRGSSFEDVLQDSTIDLVSICSPSATHKEYALRALAAGKHVLVEKPAAASDEEVKEMFDAAKAQGKVLSVYQNRRFDSDFLTVQHIVKSGILGEIHSYEAHFDRYKPQLNPKGWKEAADPTNGILYDLGAHLVDQALVLFGTPDEYSGRVYVQRANSTVDDAFHLHLRKNKVQIFLRSSLLVRDQGPKYILHGSKGSFTKYGMDVQEEHLVSGKNPYSTGFGVEPLHQRGTLVTEFEGLSFEGKVETHAGNWKGFYDALADSILKGTAPEISAEQIIKQLEILNTVKNH
jgi:scyllo-inositol 2-dehydrogenase (NADP+)